MSDIRLVTSGQTRYTTNKDDALLAVQGTRDGAIYSTSWYQRLVNAGRVYGVNVGTGTSPTTFNATYAAAEPDLWVHVPTTVAVIPLYVAVCFEDTGSAQVMDVVAVASATGDSAVTGTALTIYNMRMDAPNSSLCTATAVVTGAGTSPLAGNYVEFWRPYGGFAEDAFGGSTSWVNPMIHGSSWSAMNDPCPPVIVGGGSLSVYASGQAATGWIIAKWIEIPTNELN